MTIITLRHFINYYQTTTEPIVAMLVTKLLLVIIRHQHFGDTLARICDNKYLRVVSETNLVDIFCHQNQNKGSPDASHFIFEIKFGKGWIRHTTTLKLNF